MFRYIRIYSYIVVVSFLVNVITLGNVMALDLDAMQDLLMSEEVIQGVFGGQISNQSEPGDMDQTVAPSPKVITTSNGDVYIYSGTGASAQVSKTAEGLTEVTYTMNGARVKIKNDDSGEEFEFKYELDGATVKLVNSNGVVVREETYNNLGQLLSTSAQGTIEYVYSNDGLNTLVKSIDQWGNETIYDDQGRQDYIQYTDTEGVTHQIGDYTFDNNGILASFVDHNGNKTLFEMDGIRPSVTLNAEGTVTTTYVYNADGQLIKVVDEVTKKETTVEAGYYSQIYDIVDLIDDEGNAVLDENNQPATTPVLVGTYNYDAANNVASITDIGEEGIITGWTDYDQYGRVSGSYNSYGVKVQEYLYNDRGFLQQTIALGAFDPLTGQQARLSITNFDRRGRAMEVWQLGDGDNKVKIQEYKYQENGLLDYTVSLGILREKDENSENFNKPVDENGNLVTNGQFVYFETSRTEFDKKGRPDAVYSLVRDADGNYVSGYDAEGKAILTSDPAQALLEKQQAYRYNKRGFLDETISYGMNGTITGRTEFDRLGRPDKAYNAQGSESQLYLYDEDGFLSKTENKGENGVTTGWTIFDAKGKPTDVYNHAGTLTQKYIYDENGLMIMSINLNGEGGVNDDLVSTIADKTLIASMWNDAFDDEILSVLGDFSNTTLMEAIWDKDNKYSTDFKKMCALKLINLFSDGAKGGDQNLINDVGAAYHMLGQFLEGMGDTQGAIAAYKIQISEFGGAMAVPAEGGNPVSVSTWSQDRLSNMVDPGGNPIEVNTSVVTGYTIFGGDSKPISSYQVYEGKVTKVQDYVYSYEDTFKVLVGYDENNKAIYETVTGTKYSNYVQSTTNYGDYEDTNDNGVIGDAGDVQVISGHTEFDRYGRQEATYNEFGNVVQKYGYSKAGFLQATFSYGKDNALTGTTIFDNYSRPIASFNSSTRITSLPSDLVAALQEGLVLEYDDNGNLLVNGDANVAEAWKPYLKGLTQTFEYGTNGLLASSKSWGEAVAIDVTKLDKFAAALGSVKGDENYDINYDFNEDGAVDGEDLTILKNAFAGADTAVAAYNSTGDKTALRDFSKTFEETVKYMPTFTGETTYDKYGKASVVTNAEGVMTQKYIYNERGFLAKSESYGIEMDATGTVTLVDGKPVALLTGYTEFDAYSRPETTYQVYNDGTHGEQVAKVQEYVFDGGFLIQTHNFARNGTYAGYTDFDKYGRQTASYNEFDADGNAITSAESYGTGGNKVSSYIYSKQGFLQQTNSYGLNNAYLGKTVFDKKGRPIESYNLTGRGNTLNGLTQTFEYNQYGFLTNSTSYGEDQTITGQTFYNGYGKAVHSTNDLGIINAAYEYDEKGFLIKTISLAWVEGGGTDVATHNDLNDPNDSDVQQTGFYAVTGYTVFSDTSRPVASYQCYWDTQDPGEKGVLIPGENPGQGALVQEYNYTKGFLTTTSNYGREGTFIGTTVFDKYGRQQAVYNEFDNDGDGLGELTTRFRYSKQGFMQESWNYGLNGAVMGKTYYNKLGRPTESYNQRNALVQEFVYDDFTGALSSSKSYGEPVDGEPTWIGTTTYDVFGKALYQTNDSGNVVAVYDYDKNGFMTRAFSFSGTTGDDPLTGVCTGFTVYSAAGRPESSYSVYEPSVGDYHDLTTDSAGVTKVQDYIYNTEVKADSDILSYVGNYNTGFLTATVNYGDSYNPDNPTVAYTDAESFMGYTLFDRYGQQTTSYNELGEQTTKFQYSKSGFLTATLNYGLSRAYTGKTVYNEYGRAVEAYNERGALVQKFTYVGGFLTESESYGEPGDEAVGPVVSTTTYNAYGKQVNSKNHEEYITTSYEYSPNGFMTRSINLGTTDGQNYVETGYTLYNNKVRPTESYSVFNDGSGDKASLSQVFDYKYTKTTGRDEEGNPIVEELTSGFVTGAKLYVPDINNPGQNLEAGYTSYSKYGRPDKSYNQEGALTSVTVYSKNGFISKTDNYGENRARTGSLYYDALGRPDYAVNSKGGMTTDYIYNAYGALSQTIGFNQTKDTEGNTISVMTSYTVFDVYSKATASYQLFSGTYVTRDGVDMGYQYAPAVMDADGNVTNGNYKVNSDGSISNGFKSSINYYTSYGSIERTDNIGKDNGVVSQTFYDSFSRPSYIMNTAETPALVQVYHYSANGFLDYSISYMEMNDYDENTGAPIADGSWKTETSITYFNSYGQQTKTYLLTSDGIGDKSGMTTAQIVAAVRAIQGETGIELGAKQTEYRYGSLGFLTRSSNYQDGVLTGYTTFDPSGRQLKSFNTSNVCISTYYYNQHGFLTRSTQEA